MADFWWGTKLRWKSWSDLCRPKSIGGLGFRDLEIFNQALLAKQAWRLLSQPDSLAARIFKHKYYRNSTFIEASLGSSSSFVWQSIWSSKALLLEGLVWQVGDGRSINVWNDKWLVKSSSHMIETPCPTGLENLTVHDLMGDTGKEWNSPSIDAMFTQRDSLLIRSIPLSLDGDIDRLQWALSSDGIYKVKSAYLLGCSFNESASNPFWKKLWNLDVIPKVKHFLWQVAHNILPCRSELQRRHIIDSNVCGRCTGEAETPFHAIISCPSINRLWSSSEIMTDRITETSPELVAVVRNWMEGASQNPQLSFFKSWLSWYYRNSRLFKNKLVAPEFIEDHAKSLLEAFLQSARSDSSNQHDRPSHTEWVRPSRGWVKCNVDAHNRSDKTVLAVVCRDHQGKVMWAANKVWRVAWTPSVSEAAAVRYACILAHRFGTNNLIIEGDSKLVIDSISNQRQ